MPVTYLEAEAEFGVENQDVIHQVLRGDLVLTDFNDDPGDIGIAKYQDMSESQIARVAEIWTHDDAE